MKRFSSTTSPVTLLFFLCLPCLIAITATAQSKNEINLAGQWAFQTDASDQGITEQWFNRSVTDHIHLPGSMAGNGKGDPITADTRWIGYFS